MFYYDIPYGPHELQKYDVYTVDSVEPVPAIIWVHGGGGIVGDKIHHMLDKADHFVSRMGWNLYSVNYRLKPEVNEEDQYIDIAEAYNHIVQQAETHNTDPTRLVPMSHSAGGKLVSGLRPWVFLDKEPSPTGIVYLDPSLIFQPEVGPGVPSLLVTKKWSFDSRNIAEFRAHPGVSSLKVFRSHSRINQDLGKLTWLHGPYTEAVTQWILEQVEP